MRRRRAWPVLASLATFAIGSPAIAIIRGDVDSEDALPYVVRLKFDDGRRCSGVVLYPHTVLTAGHCLLGEGRAQLPTGADIIVWTRGREKTYRAKSFKVPQLHADSWQRAQPKTAWRRVDLGIVSTIVAIDVPLPKMLPSRDAGLQMTKQGDKDGVIAKQAFVEPVRKALRAGYGFIVAGYGQSQPECDKKRPASNCRLDEKRRFYRAAPRQMQDCAPGTSWTVALDLWCLASIDGTQKSTGGDSGGGLFLVDGDQSPLLVGVNGSGAEVDDASLVFSRDWGASLMYFANFIYSTARENGD